SRGKALHKAASDGRRTADVEKLLANGVDVNSRDRAGMTPLHLVAFLGHIKTAKLLIVHGADVNAIDDKGETPLHLAADGGQLEIIKLLLDAGADVNIKTNERKTPLDYVNKNISYWEQMLHARPAEGPGKQIAKLALDQVPTIVQSYKACAEVLQNHGAK
ncbi:unnamed protein product, partial [marine sediment metagenome]